MSDSNPFDDFEVIHTYTRAQAIEDGVLIDLMESEETRELVQQAGFKYPIAMTAEAFDRYVHPFEGELPPGQDLKGRLWDILWMLRFAIRASNKLGESTSELLFKLHCVPNSGGAPELVTLKSVCGPGDGGEPVLTIMLPSED